MARLGFRWLLPIVATAAYLWLIGRGLPPYMAAVQRYEQREVEQAKVTAPEGSTSFNFPPPPNPELVFATAIACRALFISGILSSGIELFWDVPTWFTYAISAFLVPPLWFAVGCWMDGVLGLLRRRRLRSSPTFVALHVIGLMLSLAFSLMMLIAFWTPHGKEGAIILGPWSVILTLALLERLRRYRSESQL